MTYFVTGATGFIGRHLVELLLEREGDIYVLTREGSTEKLERLQQQCGGSDRIKPVIGDLSQPLLGLDDAAKEQLAGVDHFFHLAAIYDITADETQNALANVGGTQNAVDLANALGAKRFHHMSSIAVAGSYDGWFTEDDFDEGQEFPSSYHRTKYESEKLVRERAEVPWRAYRPSLVVGNSKTGEMDKIDGPYYFFKAIQKLRHALPQWFPLISLEFGRTNLVPVDYVAAAVDHIAHQDGLDGKAFHIVDPKPPRSGDVLNTFANSAHAPHAVMRIDKRMTDMLPKGVLSYAMKVPALQGIKRSFLADLGIPEEALSNAEMRTRFDARDTARALEGSGIELPKLETYSDKLWDYWERELDPDLYKDRSFEGAVNGRTVVITGASSGIGRAAALKIAAAGGIPLLVARTQEKLDEVKAEIEAAGGTAYVYSCDLSDYDAIDQTVAQMLSDHPAIDMLVNNAGRSIRRSVKLSYDRFHDFERTVRLNYLSPVKLMLGLLPHMAQRGSGHIVNVSSIGVQTNPPRFSAYVGSKGALDAWTRVVSSEYIGDNVTFTTIHMPLVRTPMIAPTKIYDSFPTISPDEAADLICEAIRAKPKQINTRLGTFGEVAYALAPKAVDQILHMAYKVFPESAAAKGEKDPAEKASGEATALAYLMRGVHW
jgi:NAD(P)-dependent dehydrogenase (short-subunit alcohol dehydrogenase family)